MLKIQEMRELIRLIDQSTISEFVYEQDGMKVELKKTANVVAVAQPVVQEVKAPVVEVKEVVVSPKVEEPKVVEAPKVEAKPSVTDETLHKITSPMVGTFYASPSPDAPSYVAVGDKIKPDSVVCIVEAMKLFNEIEAEIKGEVVEILAQNGQLVEYGQPLFLVKPE